MTQLAIHIPTYEHARALSDLNDKPLAAYSAAELVKLIKDRALHAQAAAVILLRDHGLGELPRHFTDAEIQRYFSQLPG